jgi:hypothetical protein
VSLGDQVVRARRVAGSALRASELRDTWNDGERVDRLEVAIRENAEHNRLLADLLDGLEKSLVPLLERVSRGGGAR